MSYATDQLPSAPLSSTDIFPFQHGSQTYATTIQEAFLGQVVNPALNYDKTILAEPTLLHFFPMNEPAGATTFSDAKGSAIVMTAVQGTNSVSSGAASVLADNESSARFTAPGFNPPYPYITIPVTLFSGVTGDFSVEFIWGDLWMLPNVGPVNSPMFLSTLSTNAGFELFRNNASGSGFGLYNIFYVGGWSGSTNNVILHQGPDFAHLVLTKHNDVVTLYVNGISTVVTSAAGLTLTKPVVDGKVGNRNVAPDLPCCGRFSKFAVYNSALTQKQIDSHMNNVH